MATRLVGSALPSAPMVDQINRFSGDFEIVSGAALASAGNLMAMTLRQNATDIIAVQVQLPAHWQTMHIDIGWVVPSATAGTPTFRADVLPYAPGTDLLGALDAGANFSADAGAGAYIAVNSRVRANIVVDPTKRLCVRILRLASTPDALAANLGVYRVTLTRAS